MREPSDTGDVTKTTTNPAAADNDVDGDGDDDAVKVNGESSLSADGLGIVVGTPPEQDLDTVRQTSEQGEITVSRRTTVLPGN